MLARFFLPLATVLGLASVDTIAAQPQRQPQAEIFKELLLCTALRDGSARLACFDQRVSDMDSATQRDEVVVLDKADLSRTRRTLFGFSLPKLPFLRDGDTPAEEQIETVIGSARSLGYGKWHITLEDGAEWATTEPLRFPDARPGMKITIKRAALGSYRGSIGGSSLVRMKRVQ